MTGRRYSPEEAARVMANIVAVLRMLREAYERGEVDAEGNETAFGSLIRTSQKVESNR